MHAADLRSGRDVAVAADLRAAADERVRIDHGAVAHVRADIDVHRRHADDAFADVSSRRECWNRRERCARRRRGRTAAPGKSIYRGTAGVTGSIDMSTIAAHAEAQQDAFLDPGVDAPAAGLTVASGSAARMVPAFRPCLNERKERKVLRRVFGRRVVEEICDACCKSVRPCGSEKSGRFEHLLRSSVCWRPLARPSAAGRRVRAVP